MFRRLGRLLLDVGKRLTGDYVSADTPEMYTTQERYVYSHFLRKDKETGKLVFADKDPLVLWKTMMDQGDELNKNIKVSRSQSKDANEYHARLIKQIRSIFQLPVFDDGGPTELECIWILNHFLAFIGLEKKSTETSATSSPPVEAGGCQDSAPCTDEVPPTESSSDCGSTATVPATSTPQP